MSTQPGTIPPDAQPTSRATTDDARGAFARASAAVRPNDARSVAAALERQATLTKPAGSLGRLETLSVQLAGIAWQCPPPVPRWPAVAVFAADHGVVASGVTPWPQEVTAQMVSNFCQGGAAVSVLARSVGATLTVVDVGVVSELAAHPLLRRHKIRSGTDDLSAGPAMTLDDVRAALDIGAQVAADLVAGGADLLVTGDMGIGNTTASAAVIAALTRASAAECTGRGTGIDDAMLVHKTAIVEAAVGRITDADDVVSVLAEVGGLEIAALAGFVVGAAAARVPVVVDGVITLAATLAAIRLVPDACDAVVAGHRSVEPGASVALTALALEPLLDLGLRLGEASGATLAVPVVIAAARVLGEMATFADAAVAGREPGASA